MCTTLVQHVHLFRSKIWCLSDDELSEGIWLSFWCIENFSNLISETLCSYQYKYFEIIEVAFCSHFWKQNIVQARKHSFCGKAIDLMPRDSWISLFPDQENTTKARGQLMSHAISRARTCRFSTFIWFLVVCISVENSFIDWTYRH